MGAPVSRLGDSDSGHGPCGAANVKTASENVIAEGIGVARLGDQFTPHPPCIICCCTATQTMSSTSVFANGRGIARIGDENSCGAILVSGAGSVLAGG